MAPRQTAPITCQVTPVRLSRSASATPSRIPSMACVPDRDAVADRVCIVFVGDFGGPVVRSFAMK